MDDREKVFGFPVVDQTDLVPTLATLFSVPIPKNSLGKIIPDLFLRLSTGTCFGGMRKKKALLTKCIDPRSILRALQLNAHQMDLMLHQTSSSNTPAAVNDQSEFGDSNNLALAHTNHLHAAYARNPSDEMAAKAAAGYVKVTSPYVT